jgi:hypothetical protein
MKGKPAGVPDGVPLILVWFVAWLGGIIALAAVVGIISIPIWLLWWLIS